MRDLTINVCGDFAVLVRRIGDAAWAIDLTLPSKFKRIAPAVSGSTLHWDADNSVEFCVGGETEIHVVGSVARHAWSGAVWCGPEWSHEDEYEAMK